MRRAVRALDPRVPASVRPPVAFVERDSVAARVGRPRRDGSLDDGARLLLVAPVDMAADEESSVHSLSVGADADDPSATPRTPALVEARWGGVWRLARKARLLDLRWRLGCVPRIRFADGCEARRDTAQARRSCPRKGFSDVSVVGWAERVACECCDLLI